MRLSSNGMQSFNVAPSFVFPPSICHTSICIRPRRRRGFGPVGPVGFRVSGFRGLLSTLAVLGLGGAVQVQDLDTALPKRAAEQAPKLRHMNLDDLLPVGEPLPPSSPVPRIPSRGPLPQRRLERAQQTLSGLRLQAARAPPFASR